MALTNSGILPFAGVLLFAGTIRKPPRRDDPLKHWKLPIGIVPGRLHRRRDVADADAWPLLLVLRVSIEDEKEAFWRPSNNG